MDELTRGLYENLLTEGLARRLRTLETGGEAASLHGALAAHREELRAGDAADRVAWHLARVVRRVLDDVGESTRVETGIALARQLVAVVGEIVESSDVADDAPTPDKLVLRALRGRLPDGRPETIAEPLVPLLDTALLTNARGEPSTLKQMQSEIASAVRIDVLMAFIRQSGIWPLLDELRRRRASGATVRVLTTTFTGTTEARALDSLSEAGAEVRVSYDESSSRLHAKAWLFHRPGGFSTAYVGSSNLTHTGVVSGLEWNVRVSAARNPDVFAKMAGTFESYWEGGDFVRYEAEDFARRCARTPGDPRRPALALSPVEVRAEPFQERLLEEIALARALGRHANLLVSATGTGKTVMAALDYARLRRTLDRDRLLFVAHRKEILEQSLATFRHALRDLSFGELWVAGACPSRFEHVFASIQSLTTNGLEALAPDHFDVVIVDEFHHAAARSYERLLGHVRARELLGLTATPERADGLPVLDWFGGRIAAELRLWDAIEQQRLVPFVYYGLADDVDLREVPWRRGRGYDVSALTKVLTADSAYARRVLHVLNERVGDHRDLRVLGFCVSVDHARFMARVFSESGVAARAVWGDSPPLEREEALRDLRRGTLDVLFSVDLFNEGVDLPDVDTLLFLRPTDSPTLFLQQLGRGLRRAPGKSHCTVLDFVGLHRREFRFDRPLRALLGGTRSEIEGQVKEGFPFLPAGCYVQLDPVARDRVLAGIRAAVPSRWDRKAEELRRFADASGGEARLGPFLESAGFELEDLYSSQRGACCWSDLREKAGLRTAPSGPMEDPLRRALGRLLHVDDRARIEAWRMLATARTPFDLDALDEHARRLIRLFVVSVWPKDAEHETSLDEGFARLRDHPQIMAELAELLDVLVARIDHLHAPLDGRPEVPLLVHARYTRREILAGFGVGEGVRVDSWQTGVRYVPAARADLLAFTLDKSSGHFSPTTRYRDYAISPSLVHWESQNSAHPGSDAGRRYIEHAKRGTGVYLFARENTRTRAFWCLGAARYVRHESERPMTITWELEHPLPGDLFAAFAAAVA